MNTLQLTYFIDAAECKSFSAAAKKNLISQPAISRVISDLEEELGVSLFTRSKHGAQLTPEGELYYELFHEFMERFQETSQQALKMGDPSNGTVMIGVLSYFNVYKEIQEIRDAVAVKYPDLKIEIVFCTHFRDLMNRINRGEVQAGITVDHSVYTMFESDSLELSKANRIILYSREYPLAGGPDLTPYDFRNEPFIVVDADGNGAKRIREFCAPYGFEPEILATDGTEDSIMYLQSLKGVTIVDQWLRFVSQPEFTYIPMDEETRLVLTWKEPQENPSLRLMIEALS